MARRVYLGNAFSLNMLPLSPGEGAQVCIEKLELSEWQMYVMETLKYAAEESVEFECVIGHPSTAKLAEELVGRELKCGRKAIQLQPGDTLYAVTLAFRPEEGRVYSYDELLELYKQGKISFWAVHHGPC